MEIRRAIISVSDKRGIVEFAKGLKELGVEILSTGGTAKKLRENNIEVVDIAEYTGFPEILDGRLKTLHPLIHGGILGKRSAVKHQREMKKNKIKPIDMVVVNLYPFEDISEDESCTLEKAIENIDIGGPTMLRAAAKNYKDVATVVDPDDYESVLSELKKNNGSLGEVFAFALAQKVFAFTARYDCKICNYLNAVKDGKATDAFPDRLGLTYTKVQDLRYGENPHQRAVFYKGKSLLGPSITNSIQLHGKELSYNNIMDADAAIAIVKEFNNEIFATILKHTNPCGAASSERSLLDAFNKAKETDPASAFGGIVGLTKEVDEETALAIGETFFEVIVAPDFSEGALKVLQQRKNIRLLRVPGLGRDFTTLGWNIRKVLGGLLVQDRDLGSINIHDCKVPTNKKPTEEEYKAVDFARRICKHVKSNATVFAAPHQLLGVGAGQMSRIDSVKIATMKMNENFPGYKGVCVLASDAFFPFRDGVDAAASAGASAIVQPGGSIRDDESIQAANENKISMVITGMRHFKH